MEEIFYILLAVAWVAFSIFSANKKKKERQKAPPAEATLPPDTPRRSILEDILMGDEPADQTKEIDEREVVIQRKPIMRPRSEHRIPQPFQEIFAEIQSRQSASHASTISNPQAQVSDAQHRVLDLHPIDLRKAVIYSIILERPYA